MYLSIIVIYCDYAFFFQTAGCRLYDIWTTVLCSKGVTMFLKGKIIFFTCLMLHTVAEISHLRTLVCNFTYAYAYFLHIHYLHIFVNKNKNNNRVNALSYRRYVKIDLIRQTKRQYVYEIN